MASYTDFQPEPEDNVAVSPKGIPSSFTGPELAAFCRNLAAALRNLGDTTPKLGDQDGPSAVLGSIAYQSASAVSITGGAIENTLGGFVPVGGVIPFHGTVADAEAWLTQGYGVCDGRTIAAFRDVIGVSRGPFTMPDLRYYYLRFYGTADDRTILPQAESGRFDERDVETQPAGAHDHGGATEGHALTGAELPIELNSGHPQGGSALANLTFPQTAAAHAHGIVPAADHAHFVDVTNPFVAVVPLKRLF